MKVLAWYINPTGIKNKKLSDFGNIFDTQLVSENLQSALKIPEWYKKKMIPILH